MNWHTRYLQQARWTRNLRSYIFKKAGLEHARRVLEAGCGTGAILAELPMHIHSYGLDIDAVALAECQTHAPHAFLARGNALQLPYLDQSFDIVYCHFLLLWVSDPLQALREMKRVTRRQGYVIAFAEPDYFQRVDQPADLLPLGKWQTESLMRQGANPGLGSGLAELFFRAGINILETGTIQGQEQEPPADEWEIEWDVIESDLNGQVSKQDLQKMKLLDKKARERGTRVLHVPTYFAWGQG